MRNQDVPFLREDYDIEYLIAHWQARRQNSYLAAIHSVTSSDALRVRPDDAVEAISPKSISSQEEVSRPRIPLEGEILVQAEVVVLGDRTNEGQLIKAVTIAWEEIIKEIALDREFLNRIPWRKLEELIAGAYEREGWPEVILTPRSGDKGRDIIATKPGFGSIRIFDQVKAYAPGHKVTAEEIRALLGVLQIQGNVSKGIVTTTSDFAPGIFEEVRQFMPHRLELKNGNQLYEWLLQLPVRD